MKKEEIKKFISYFFVGGVAAIVEWITFYFSNKIFHFDISTIIAFLIATFANYILGKKLTFKDYKKKKKDIYAVYIVSFIGLILNLLFMKIFVDYFHVNELFSKIMSTGLVFFWNYFSRRIFIYNENKKNNISSFITKYQKVIKVISSILIYVGLVFQNILPAYNVLSLLMFFLIIYFVFHYKNNNYVKREKIVLYVLTLLFTIILLINMYANITLNITDVIGLIDYMKMFISFIGNYLIIYMILDIIYHYLKIVNIFNSKRKISNKKLFIISFVAMFLIWLIYLLTYYPGSLSPDSLIQLGISLNKYPWSDHHPVLHTLFIKTFLTIGKTIFGTMNAGICLTSLVQMLIQCSIFSSFLVFLNKRKVNIYILFSILAYYTLSPMFSFFSITMWKDVLFGSVFLVLLMVLIKLIESKKITIKQMIILIITILLFLFFRNNALYIYIFTIPFMLYMFKNNYKKIILTIIITLSIFFVVKGPVFKSFGITKSSSAEYIAIPLQQIARMVTYDIKLSDEERLLINNLVPIEVIKEKYTPYSCDPIKFNKDFNIEVFNENKGKYLKLWLNLVIKNPKIALEGYLISTVGYWNPNFQNWSVYTMVDENDFGVYNDSKLPEEIKTGFSYYISKDMPILGMQWSIGLCFWVILFFSLLTYLKGNKKYLFIFVPILGLWLTMMIASPVYGEFRYVYGAFVTLPLYLLLPYFKKHDLKEE